MPLHITRNDISRMRTQAVVCPANSGLRIGGGAGGAVARIAGVEVLQEACDKIGGCPIGKAVATPAFGFPAEVLIHAVGPVWNGGGSGEFEALRSCVAEALALAVGAGAETVAMPLLSAGSFGFPPQKAIEVETHAIESFLSDHDIDVWLVLFDNESIRAGRALFDDIEEYIDDVYVGGEGQVFDTALAAPQTAAGCSTAKSPKGRGLLGRGGKKRRQTEARVRQDEACERGLLDFDEPLVATSVSYVEPGAAPPRPDGSAALQGIPVESLAERLEKIDESFAQTVLRLIDERGMTDVEVYKRANMSRQLFAKIRKDDGYRPSKRTACALAFALGLDHGDTLTLLARAGFTLSHSSRFDIIVEYFLVRGIHDIYQVNEALFAFDQQLLG